MPLAVGQGIAYGVVGDGLPIERRQQVRPIGVAVSIVHRCGQVITIIIRGCRNYDFYWRFNRRIDRYDNIAATATRTLLGLVDYLLKKIASIVIGINAVLLGHGVVYIHKSAKCIIGIGDRLASIAYGGDIPLVVIGVRVRSLAVVPGFHLGRGGRRAGVHIGDGGADHGGAAVFGGQARHAAEAVIGVVGGDGTLRRLGQPVILVIGVGAACCPDVAVSRGKESEGRKKDSGQHPGRFTLFCRNTFQCGILLFLLMLIPGVYFSSPRYANCGSVSSANLIMYRDRIPTLSASAVSSSIYSMAKRYLSWVVSTS